MSDTPPEFDLKFLPDWLKEGPAEKNYANYEGDSGDARRYDRGRDDRGGGGGRGPRPGRGDQRSRGPGGDRGGRPGDRGKGGGPRREGGGPRGGKSFERRAPAERPAPAPPPPPIAPVKIEFLPEPNGAGNIAKQIKQSGRAYPLFGTGRLFLERPERHRVRISSLDPKIPMYQIGDGPVSFDRAIIERNAFRAARDEYYKEEVTQGEALKGNFTNVARTRGTGLLIGPTNHHSYQPNLRRIYEERFSRRMSFPDFVQQEIEVVTDEQTINDWKDQARSSTTYTSLKEPEPISFKSANDAEQHFRKVYLPQIVKSGTTLECSGQASRALPDRSVSAAVREAWEKERAFPAGLVNYLRSYLLEAGLHFFKHRKRILYISAIKPVHHATGQALSPTVAAILNTIESSQKCTRRILATKILGEHHDAPEIAEQKAALARDLHYLVHTGNVIEFHDGTLDLPLVPGAGQSPQGAPKPAAPPAPRRPMSPEQAGADPQVMLGASDVMPAATAEDIHAGVESQLSGSGSLESESALPAVPQGDFTDTPSDAASHVDGAGALSNPGTAIPLDAPVTIQGTLPQSVFVPIQLPSRPESADAPPFPSAVSLVDESGDAGLPVSQPVLSEAPVPASMAESELLSQVIPSGDVAGTLEKIPAPTHEP